MIVRIFREMFSVEMTEGPGGDGEDDEIDKSIKEIHQSAHTLAVTDSIPLLLPPVRQLQHGEFQYRMLIFRCSNHNLFRWREFRCSSEY